MSLSFVRVSKIGTESFASVTVEIVPSNEFQVRSDLRSPLRVQDLEGNLLAPIEIEVACMSGATYARHVLPLNNSRVVIRAAEGRISLLDIRVFSIATVIAIARAMGQRGSLWDQMFQDEFRSWEVYKGD